MQRKKKKLTDPLTKRLTCNNNSILATNHDITKQLTFNDVIVELAKKPRKKCVM